MLTMHKETDYLSEALTAGASGYLLKQEADPELINAVKTIRSGKTYLSPISVIWSLIFCGVAMNRGASQGSPDPPGKRSFKTFG